MGKVKDLIGQEFHRLKVVSFHGVENGRAYWDCECECGNTKVALGRDLTRGHTKSCGCLQAEKFANVSPMNPAVQKPVVEYRENALVFLDKPSWEQAETTVNTLMRMHTASGLWIGDAAIQLEAYYPQTYSQFFPDGEISKTILNKMAIARKIPPPRRRDVYPSVVDVAAGFDTEAEQDEIIRLASEDGLTVEEVRQVAREMKGKPRKAPKSHSVACPECNHVFIYEEVTGCPE